MFSLSIAFAAASFDSEQRSTSHAATAHNRIGRRHWRNVLMLVLLMAATFVDEELLLIFCVGGENVLEEKFRGVRSKLIEGILSWPATDCDCSEWPCMSAARAEGNFVLIFCWSQSSSQ